MSLQKVLLVAICSLYCAAAISDFYYYDSHAELGLFSNGNYQSILNQRIGSPGSIVDLAYHPGKQGFLVVESSSTILRLWDMKQSITTLFNFSVPPSSGFFPAFLTGVAYDPLKDTVFLLANYYDVDNFSWDAESTIYTVDLTDGTLTELQFLPEDLVRCLTWDSDNNRLLGIRTSNPETIVDVLNGIHSAPVFDTSGDPSISFNPLFVEYDASVPTILVSAFSGGQGIASSATGSFTSTASKHLASIGFLPAKKNSPPQFGDGGIITSVPFGEVRKPFELRILCDDPDNDSTTVTVDFGDGTIDSSHTCSVDGVVLTHTYKAAKQYCIGVCLDDGQDQGESCAGIKYNCQSTVKRATTTSSLLFGVLANGAGDPYFKGIGDGNIFRFDGQVGHMYNLVSAPYVQVNTRIDKGWAVDHVHSMHTIMGAVVVHWDHSNSLMIQISNSGELSAKIVTNGVSFDGLPQEEVYHRVGSMHLHWLPVSNSSLEFSGPNNENLRQHRVLRQLTFQHQKFMLEVSAVEMIIRDLSYYFLDLQLSQQGAAASSQTPVDCWDGVWGRTACQPSDSPFDMGEFDLDGQLFSVDFPLHNQYTN